MAGDTCLYCCFLSITLANSFIRSFAHFLRPGDSLISTKYCAICLCPSTFVIYWQHFDVCRQPFFKHDNDHITFGHTLIQTQMSFESVFSSSLTSISNSQMKKENHFPLFSTHFKDKRNDFHFQQWIPSVSVRRLAILCHRYALNTIQNNFSWN